uniref:Uncharacterized protein n=1 Tax=Anguilla anguilla TaxID=7936 RepID=A0A0E9PCY7_ANGAN
MPERSSRCLLERDNGGQVEADPFQTAYFQLPDKTQREPAQVGSSGF